MEEKRRKEMIEWVVALLIAAVAALLFRIYVAEFLRADGSTMRPTLESGERIISLKMGEAARGDIIVFQLPADPRRYFVKRVVGLPGEEISIAGGQVYINGTLLPETYLGSVSSEQTMAALIIPEDHYFVMGDNRAVSLDSRDSVMGTIPGKNIRGKAIAVYWPLRQIRIIR
ncbi:MAG: signal peptidase I [Negativicutes bacterium]|nr:signal peptidase I [Negativicutes bacterium]